MNWWAATTALVGLTKGFPDKDQQIVGIDVGDTKAQEDKALGLASKELAIAKQKAQLDNPDARINLEAQDQQTLLMQFAIGVQGLATHDDPRFACVFWEFSGIGHPWECLAGTVEASMFYGGRTYVFKWGGGEGEYKNNAMALKAEGRLGGWKSGKEAWGKRGVSVSQMRILPCTLYTGEFFDHSAAAVIPQDSSHLAAVWCFCSSPEFHTEVRKIDQAVKVTNASLVKIPFDLAHWQRVAAEKYPNGLPKPHSDDPTQWLFNGHPAGADQPLQVAVARLLGYRWPRQTGSEFPDCPALGPDGLEPLVDTDGIVCISAIKGEQSAAERLRALLAAAFGMEWSATKQAELLEQSGFAGKTLDEWLRNGFFEQHCQLFHQRPFIWQLWDGLRDGFSVLVNYHKLTRSALEKLTYTYLGDWLARQKASVAAGEEGSDAKLAAAQKLKTALEKILEGESPYDIFVRWKPLAKQPIGWEPDLNDGVRLNIRPFVEAGILRKTPKIHWRKDRGNDVPSAPWYKLFNGDRINDHHLTLAEKREGRDG
jgi:hypothetical protein